MVWKKSLPARPLPAVDKNPGVGILHLGEGGVDPFRGGEKIFLDLLSSRVIDLKQGTYDWVIISWAASQSYFDVEELNVVLR